jgi:hypothetical protein
MTLFLGAEEGDPPNFSRDLAKLDRLLADAACAKVAGR